MNFREVRIKTPKQRHTITVIPVEAHYSLRRTGHGFCGRTWAKLLRRVEKDPNCYVVFVGDMIDADRPSMRQRKAVVYAEADRRGALEEDDLDHQRGLREGIIKDLKPIKHKILGMVDGDHFRVYANGTTSTWYIATALGIPKTYLGERMGWIKLVFEAFGSICSYTILVRHGKGAAATFGGDITALVKQGQGFDADLYLGGHTHKSWFVSVPWLYPGKSEILSRIVAYARAGSLLRGFLYGEITYAEVAEYNPLSVGFPEIYITTTRSYRGPLAVVEVKGLT